MLGWINDCIEKLVINKFGVEAWHIVKQKAGCNVADGEFFKLEAYTDKSSLDLVMAASEVAGLTRDQVLEAFGEFFVHYIRDESYDNLLCCQGSTLKDWMSNINAIHQHLQTTFPKKMIMPQFWVEDSEQEDGSLMLHYHSRRGNYLAPLAKGLVSEIASYQFGFPIDMTRTQTQGENGAKFTSWKATAVNPEDTWKLTQKEGSRNGIKNSPTQLKCPFTGMTTTFHTPEANSSDTVPNFVELYDETEASEGDEMPEVKNESSRCPFSGRNQGPKKGHGCPTKPGFSKSESTPSNTEKAYKAEENVPSYDSTTATETSSTTASAEQSIGVSAAITKKLFPYHVIVDENFVIRQVGDDLPSVLKDTEADLVGDNIADVFVMTKPIGMDWDWQWIRKLGDQAFDVKPTADTGGISRRLRFKATVKHISEKPQLTMLILTPDANNLEDLRKMNLTLSDLPVHGAHRDAVFLREHLSTHMNNALKMEKLSKSLAREKALLESLLPEHAAAGLRAGKTVEPMLHNNVTFFFSDIVGFTNICEQIYPWDVISMLNRLYGAMDYLAGKFNLFKVETIGDAYVCCSGLPQADEDHAKNVANFAIAVNHCCQQVLSPLDEAPIRLRIGINSGSCASGVVGMTNPRYCVFGDTVNTTARHESTGAPGKIHCSQTTQEELQEVAPGNFSLQERGYIDMKGKGELLTYWLEASESNELVNKAALEKLDDEVKDLLAKGNFDNKVGPQKTGKTDDSSMKQLERGSGNSASMMKKTPDPLSNTLKEAMRSDSWKSLAASPEKKVKSREVQRNDSFITSIEEAVVLASGYDSLSGFDESETEINLKFEAGQQLELLKRSAQFVAEEKLEVRVERNADKYERPSKPVKCGKNTPSDQGRSKRTRKRNANEKKTTSAEPVPAVKPLDSFEIGYKVNYAQYLLPSRTATYRS